MKDASTPLKKETLLPPAGQSGAKSDTKDTPDAGKSVDHDSFHSAEDDAAGGGGGGSTNELFAAGAGEDENGLAGAAGNEQSGPGGAAAHARVASHAAASLRRRWTCGRCFRPLLRGSVSCGRDSELLGLASLGDSVSKA